METINTYIDHTLLDPLAKRELIIALCSEANLYRFRSVCVHGCHVSLAHEQLRESETAVCTVVGFPLGANDTAAKMSEAEIAVNDGATEIDMVVNQGWIKDKAYHKILQEVHFLKQSIGGATLKVIIETANLSKQEIVKTSETLVEAGADYIKTSTGFASRGASLEDISLIKSTIGNQARIKASGGIKTYDQARAFIDAGANRIGTSSGVAIMKAFGKK